MGDAPPNRLHPICVECRRKLFPEQFETDAHGKSCCVATRPPKDAGIQGRPGLYAMPRLAQGLLPACCWCNRPATDNMAMIEEPEKLLCKGKCPQRAWRYHKDPYPRTRPA